MPRKVLMASGTIMKCFGTRLDSEGKSENVYTNDGLNWQKVKKGLQCPPAGATLHPNGLAGFFRDKKVCFISKYGRLLEINTGSNINIEHIDSRAMGINRDYVIGRAAGHLVYMNYNTQNLLTLGALNTDQLTSSFYYNIEGADQGSLARAYYIPNLDTLEKLYLDIEKYCDFNIAGISMFTPHDDRGTALQQEKEYDALLIRGFCHFYNGSSFSVIYRRRNRFRDSHTNTVINRYYCDIIIVNHQNGEYDTIDRLSYSTSNLSDTQLSIYAISSDKIIFWDKIPNKTYVFTGGRIIPANIDMRLFVAIFSPALDGFLAIFKDTNDQTKQGFSRDGINWEFSQENITSLGFSF